MPAVGDEDAVVEADMGPTRLAEALESMEAGGRIHFRGGQFQVGGPVQLDGRASVTADPDAILLGR